MDLKTAIEILDYHQEWRLGKRDDMIHEPKKLTQALDIVLAKVKENELLHSVRLRAILEDRLKSHKEDYDNAWKNLTSESKYKKEDGIEPFYRLQRLYKTKAEEIQIILDLYEA